MCDCIDFVCIMNVPGHRIFRKEEIIALEASMLCTLNFELSVPTSLVFLKRFGKVAGITSSPRSKTDLLSSYLVELSMQE